VALAEGIPVYSARSEGSALASQSREDVRDRATALRHAVVERGGWLETLSIRNQPLD